VRGDDDHLHAAGRACNPSGCSSYASAQNTSVVVLTWLEELPPDPVVPPNVPAQGWVGTIPGTPSTEGGAATYRIPIVVPPGRAGMQPDITLTYSSRNGNGVAGVGWSVSGTRTIYRCPRTLEQEGGNRRVLRDLTTDNNFLDRLCFDGQGLVGPTDATYGKSGSVYRTEIDQFDRITLNGNMNQWLSYFQVEHKSGRVSQYKPASQPGSAPGPDVWYLVREFDRQGNCVAYNYRAVAARGSNQD